jgi:hypothetical protein
MAKSARAAHSTPADKLAPATPAASAPSPQTASEMAKDKPGPKLAGKGGVKVRATKMGYYGDIRRRVGDVFIVAEGDPLSDTWMEPVDRKTPEKITTGKEALTQYHDEKIGGKVVRATGDANVLGDDE